MKFVGVRATNKSVVAPPKSIWKNENLIYIPLAITAPTGSSARSRYANRSGPLFIIIVSNRDDSHGKGKGARGSVVRWGGFQDDPLFRFIDMVSMVVVIEENQNEVTDNFIHNNPCYETDAKHEIEKWFEEQRNNCIIFSWEVNSLKSV